MKIAKKSFFSNYLKLFLLIFVSCAIIYASSWVVQKVRLIPIAVVELKGQLIYTSKQEIITSVADLVVNKGFFEVQIAAVKSNLYKLPWTSSVKVRRIWPNKLSIALIEKVPLAIWNKHGIITNAGEIIYPVTLDGLVDLPNFIAKDNYAQKMLENYLLFLEVLKPNGMAIKELEIMADNGLRAMLDNKIELFLGHERFYEKLNRFVHAYRGKLGKMINKVAYVDLRYINGIAVGWKDKYKKG